MGRKFCAVPGCLSGSKAARKTPVSFFGFPLKNEELKGRAWHAVSGVGSFLIGLGLAATLPASGLVAPGVALGGRLSSNGATKVAVGLAGKEIADKRKKN